MRIKSDIIRRPSSLFAFYCLISFAVAGQPVSPGLTSPEYPLESGEKIRLLTDRSIYCVNEKLHFTAEYACAEELKSLSWSNVLYIELIRWNGTGLAGMKLRLTGETASGYLEIPGTVPSGNYYLRAYTRWMRNYPAEKYAYTGVKIVNPFRPETDEGPAEGAEQPGVNTLKLIGRGLINGIGCATDKNEYKPGETAEVRIGINSKEPLDFDRYCITVVKKGMADTTDSHMETPTGSAGGKPEYAEYLPEIRGIAISGEVYDRSEGLPLRNVLVSLSETQSGQYFATYKTDERGRFVFSLPDMEQKHDFFVQTEVSSVIRIDNGYCNRPVRLQYIPFSMNRDEADFVREVMVNQQITDRFLHDRGQLTDPAQVKPGPMVFYGSKKTVYHVNKYIELPDIREFIFEIIIEANIFNDREKNSAINMRRSEGGYYPPLVLMDNIRVEGNDKLLKIPLSRIERVEVINSDYMVGTVRYHGIMSFYSVNQDFAGLELNKNSLFFSYDLFTGTLPVPDFSSKPADQRTPDRRNLLYWNPDIRLRASEKATVSFLVSDCKGEYEVFIRSRNHTDQDGIYGMCRFTVK